MVGPRGPCSPCWEEDACLDYYGLQSLHRMFQVVGAQLTEQELSVLSFLLDEALPAPEDGEPRLAPVGGPGRPPARSGLEFLLELERRGQCDEAHLGPLMQLLRVLARQDLLPRLSLKRARPVSPERYGCGPSGSDVERPEGSCLGSTSTTPQRRRWEAAGSPPGKRQRRSLGRSSAGGRRRRGPQGASRSKNPVSSPAANKVTCDIRLRVRAEYCEHGAALAQGVVSRRPQSVARQLDLFGQAMAVLKSRDLGSVVCDIKFSELSYLDAFWGDYLSGALLQALRGVFLTEALREAVGREPIRLLVSVDEGDYEAGRRRLLLLGGRPPGGTRALPPR
ncbi:DNA-binding death effector domain-containing protein 2 isoform X1 [Vombatus ursinus]|uniref:DNA-binding death effector domain-containing protein 2 isoform X1 n=1 Tax=Vombatus ursinus TaxID=29139 RepID=UPI000FFD2BF6|nr:DNA-binding death effector domain-containing protein 2 isoform X1 [Vombatus ursinus]XP_027713962.1 DNA-binding death effector domain-containing protein 2 isoform X1 [Vombatus ursinus]XP_027713963.1 DNA-binding death effector domain-containing protein 2 isoform X1 [Vombatus ursinus]XP_027713964.1 DNA-binding death effector domain-containing protein 2 isoform X1 [Vombatus ursinus]XP_027713965.1 DNA-binding death effector domain-containing protein 2 isoform X1 [Vombatus ursinus]XP_027713966.1 